MAEVIDIPQPNKAALSREHSSLEGGGLSVGPPNNSAKPVVSLKKKSFGQRFKETFIADDIHDVGDFILWDVIVPAIGRTINDAICGASNRIFLGGYSAPQNVTRDRGVTRVAPRTNTNYSSIARGSSSYVNDARPLPTRRGGGFHLNEWQPMSRPVAEQILSEAVDYLEEYHRLTVDDYYQIAEKYVSFDFKVDYTAQSWGWRNLGSAEVVMVQGGAIIRMPNPVAL